ncbi:unnamed protein product [Callosobruchus maculatus]|uniref:C2H2-type domain-containing protein n=2 Tax=Callosobruchus maculatus TaxID=64391 RepID=A0A653DD35_CALMS|nr:unnamed protein product [Callosobruchus maculatus]
MSKHANAEKSKTSSPANKKQNVIIFKPEEIAKFGLFGMAEKAGASGTKTAINTESGETYTKNIPTTSRQNASITPKTKWKTRKDKEDSTPSDDKTESESKDYQSGIDVKRKIGDILKKTFEEMKRSEPDKFQVKGTSSVSGTKISLDCDTKSEIVSLLKLAKDKKEAGIETETVKKGANDSSKKVNVIGITSVKYSEEEIQNILKGCSSSSNEPKSNTAVESDILIENEINKAPQAREEEIVKNDLFENSDVQSIQISTKEVPCLTKDTSVKINTGEAKHSVHETSITEGAKLDSKTGKNKNEKDESCEDFGSKRLHKSRASKDLNKFTSETVLPEDNIDARESPKTSEPISEVGVEKDSQIQTELSILQESKTSKNVNDVDEVISEPTAPEENLDASKSAKNSKTGKKQNVKDTSCESRILHESRASKNLNDSDEIISETAAPEDNLDAGKSPKIPESKSEAAVEKNSQVQSQLNIDNPAGFDYYIIQFPPSDGAKSTCVKDPAKLGATEHDPTEEPQQPQRELDDNETQKPQKQPAKKMEDIDIEDELSYSVLTMDQSIKEDQPKNKNLGKRKPNRQESHDAEVPTSEKVVKVINVEKHPEPVGDESIFKVNVVLEGSKPEVVDNVSWRPRKRKQQMDCKVDEVESVEKRSKTRGRKKSVKDDDFVVDPSRYKNVRQYENKAHAANQKPVEDESAIKLEDVVTVKNEDAEIVEKTPKKIAPPVDVQKIPVDETNSTTKKRGRPKRSKQPYMEEDVPATVFCPLEASKSGRKRRKINYFNLENSLYGDPEDGSMGSGKKKGRPRKVKAEDDPQKGSQSTTDESFIGEQSDADLSLAETLVQSETFANHNPGVQTNELINEPEESKDELTSLEKVRKYRRTGKTVEMLNSIFTAAVNTLNDTNLDRSVDGQKEQTPVNMVKRIKLKGKRDRRYKREETFELNEKNEVTCVVCQAKIPFEEWDDHNSSVHYDLSWRAGENMLLDIDLETFVKKKVDPYLKRLKRLVCDKCQAEFNVSSEFINHREECFGISVNNMVICALCKEEMTKDKFYGHRQKKHNSLAWRVGDVPLDLTNQHFVMSVLNARYKAKKPLYCYKCDTAKKSVIGYLSHQSQCGVHENDAKIPCAQCGRKVLPVSMPVHIKMVHETPKINKMMMDQPMEQPVLDDKRRAAKNAMSIITMFSKGNLIGDTSKYYVENPEFTEDFVKYFLQKEANTNKLIKCKFKGCKYTTLDVNIMVAHLISCASKPPKYYTCRKCLETYSTVDELLVHVKDIHNKNPEDENVQLSDEDSDENVVDKGYLMRKTMMQKVVIKTKKAEVVNPYKVKPLCIAKIPRPGRSMLFSSAFEYTLEFCNNYFSQNELFNHLHCTKENWKLIDESLIQKYLPQSEISCEVGIKQVRGFEEVNQCFFNRFELFEVKIQESPINALCWQPTPYLRLDCRQLLAVAVINDFETKYNMKSNYAEPTAIQLWDFGNLKNKHSITMPRLMYCLSLNIGPVWHMEWCPSGCFDEISSTNDETFNRLGLLAVAGSIPDVHIYAIPKINEEDCNTQDCGRGSYYPTKISWCKASRHSILAVGYTNGMVAMFNLDCDSSLLKHRDEDEVDVLLPYKSVQAHTFSISILQVLHHSNGDRWVLTGGMDKSYIWDLKNDTFINLSPKKLILDGIWLTHWLSSITTHDEVNLVKDPGSLLTSLSSVSSISSSDWLNAIITGNLAGEILAYFPQQLSVTRN